MNYKFRQPLPWYKRIWLIRRFYRRDIEAGLDHIVWASQLRFNDDWVSLDDPAYGQFTPQALNAQCTLKLYNWWKHERPARPDPSELSGWNAYCATKDRTSLAFLDTDSETPEQRKKGREILEELHKIELQYDNEDTERMIELIKIRDSLWT
jgi:hypothetical protein